MCVHVSTAIGYSNTRLFPIFPAVVDHAVKVPESGGGRAPLPALCPGSRTNINRTAQAIGERFG
jgi:hypothetical protein